ncbi:MAG: hypothetical protein FD149_38 [Rhodospirillaceae bacterium]|nr:MAG: hypothetical protein FD149_38 [Rhodospirillaceae bacterium]
MKSRLVFLVLVTGLAWGVPEWAAHAETAGAEDIIDPERVVGSFACAQCHKAVTTHWQASHHANALNTLVQKPEAATMAGKLDIRNADLASRCTGCHATIAMDRRKRVAVGGVSCESCHGAGFAWNKPHAEFSGKTRETESAEERTRRWRRAEREGMLRPVRVYEWAKRCYACHVPTDEELVDRGGHKPGDESLELLAWSLGEVRHAIAETPGAENRLPDRERQRLIFLVGVAVNLETALRAVAESTTKGPYAVAMAKRARAAQKTMRQIATLLALPEITQILAASEAVGLRINHRVALLQAAEAVAVATRAMVEKYDGSVLAALDGLLPDETRFKGKP